MILIKEIKSIFYIGCVKLYFPIKNSLLILGQQLIGTVNRIVSVYIKFDLT